MLCRTTARLAKSRHRSISYCHSLALSSLSREAGWPGPCAPRACWWRCCSAWTAWDRRSPRRLQTPPVTRSALSSRDCSPDSNGSRKPLCQVSKGSPERPPAHSGKPRRARWLFPERAALAERRRGRALCYWVPGNGRCAGGLAPSTEGGKQSVCGLCPHAPGSRCCQGVCKPEQGTAEIAFLAPIFGEGGKVGAGSRMVLANRLHNVEMVIREFITLTHTFFLSWTHGSGHTFSTVCSPCLPFPSLGSRGWPGPSAGKVKHKSLNPQGLVKTH